MAGSSQPLRLVFAGTPSFAAQHLQALVDSQHQLLAVYTQPDRPAGRGKKLSASPVKTLAERAAIPVCQPHSLKSVAAQATLAQLNPDVFVVVAYGLILPQEILDIPRLGCINVHASLLPRWRGAAPIQRAIEAGDSSSGVTIMRMEAGLDTGPMLASVQVPVTDNMSAGQLHDALMDRGAALLLQVLDSLEPALHSAQTQNGESATYAHKIEKSEAEIDWSLDALVLQRKILAYNPIPVAWTLLGGQRLKLWAAQAVEIDVPTGHPQPGEIIDSGNTGITVACGSNALRLTQLQLPGGKALQVSQLMLARRDMFAPGAVMGH